MLPQTFLAILTFLGLVAPGMLFELLRERRHPSVDESTFHEVSRIGLASFAFTTISTFITVAAFENWLGLDVAEWIRSGWNYVKENPVLAISIFAVELLLAFLLATIVDLVIGGGGSLSRYSLWHRVFREELPHDATPWVHVGLTDGSSFFGHVRASTADSPPDSREIILEGRNIQFRAKSSGGDVEPQTKLLGHVWEYVVISSANIQFVKVHYMSKLEPGAIVKSKRRVAIEGIGATGAKSSTPPQREEIDAK